jgi:hypothetical protein
VRPAEAMRALSRRGLKVPRFDELDGFTGHPFPIPALVSDEMDAADSLHLWAEARSTPGLGLSPLLVGAEPMLDDLGRLDTLAATRRIRDRIRRASAPPERVLAARAGRLADRFSPVVLQRLAGEMASIRPAWRVGPGAEPPSMDAASVLQMDPGEPVRCLLLGCAPWEIPLYLGLGGRSGAPEPHEQAVLLRGWHERHGAALVHVGRGAVAVYADRPARRIEELRPLLWEVFLYSHDAVFQDHDGAFGGLRRMLAQPWWLFSWD